MGQRTSDPRRIPGNPLAGVLRSTARAARTPRRRIAPVIASPVVEAPAPPPVPQPRLLAAVVACDGEGRASWTFPAQLRNAPVVTATAVAQGPALVMIESLDERGVILLVCDSGGVTAPQGTAVHLVAVVTA